MEKKTLLRIRRREMRDLIGFLTEDVVEQVCVRTGLHPDDVLESIEKLELMGVIDREEATVH